MDATGRMFEALALGRLEKEQDAHSETRRQLSRVTQLLREEFWDHHGCDRSAQYGDDGEMQCATCLTDFRRMPMEDLITFVQQRRMLVGAKRVDAQRAVPENAITKVCAELASMVDENVLASACYGTAAGIVKQRLADNVLAVVEKRVVGPFAGVAESVQVGTVETPGATIGEAVDVLVIRSRLMLGP